MDDLLNTLLPALGVTLLLMGLLIRRVKRRQQQAKPVKSARQTQHEMSKRARQVMMKEELDEVSAELLDLTRTNAAILNQKTMALEQVIEDADQRHAELKKTLAKLDEKLEMARRQSL